VSVCEGVGEVGGSPCTGFSEVEDVGKDVDEDVEKDVDEDVEVDLDSLFELVEAADVAEDKMGEAVLDPLMPLAMKVGVEEVVSDRLCWVLLTAAVC
jgi:hypothetical protein